jgi:hypothetical protein
MVACLAKQISQLEVNIIIFNLYIFSLSHDNLFRLCIQPNLNITSVWFCLDKTQIDSIKVGLWGCRVELIVGITHSLVVERS